MKRTHRQPAGWRFHFVPRRPRSTRFESVDAGPLTAARHLEPLAMLWIELAMKRGHARAFAFAMVRHP
jgi:hypothetical protein